MNQALSLLGPWTLYHAIFDSLDRPGVWWSLIWFVCPALLWMALWARNVPRSWLWLVGLVGLQNLIAPQAHYLIPAVPFLCLMAAITYKRVCEEYFSPWKALVLILLAMFTLGRIGAALVRPWGLFGMRTYGVMDNYYYADQIKKANVQGPVWCNWPAIYFIMGWPVPGNDFIAQINDGVKIDWDKPPYDKVRTRIYFRREAFPITFQGGWTVELWDLERGQFTAMWICRRWDKEPMK